MNNKEFKKIQKKLLKVADAYTLEKLVLKKKIKGNLIDILRSLNEEQLNILERVYLSDKEIKLQDEEKFSLLDEKIKKAFVRVIEANDSKITNTLDEFFYNRGLDEVEPILLIAGFIYAYKVRNKLKYLIPDDLLLVYLDKALELKEEDLLDKYTFLMNLFFNYGLIPKDILLSFKDKNSFSKEELLEHNFIIKKINRKEYLWNEEIPYLDSYADGIEKRDYVKRDFYNYNDYMVAITPLFVDLYNLVEKSNVNTDDFYDFAIPLLLSKKRNLNEIGDAFTEKYKLSKKTFSKVIKILFEYQCLIRYWEYGGKNIKENNIDKNILSKKPKEFTLLSCLEKLDEEKLKELIEEFEVKDTLGLRDILFSNIVNRLHNHYYEFESLDTILKYQNKEYDYNEDVTEFISDTYCFLYKDKNKLKVIVPLDIKEEIENNIYTYLDDEVLTDDDYVNLYVFFNGVIEKKRLQEMLKVNHNLDYTISEMDKIVEHFNIYTIDDCYYLPFLTPDMAHEKIIPFKRALNKYKVITNADLNYFTMLDTFSLKFDNFFSKIKISEENFMELFTSVMILLGINEPFEAFLRYFFYANNIKIKEAMFKELVGIINSFKDDFPIWIYNGYSNNEFSVLNK